MDIIKCIKPLVAAVALTAAPAITQAQEYFLPLSMEGVELMGGIKYGMLDYESITVMDKGFYLFKQEDLYQVDRGNPVHRNYVAGGSVYHEGKIYSNEYEDAGGMHKEKPMWRIYDAKTFEVLSEHELPDNCAATTTSLAYDRTRNKIYGFLYTFTEVFFVEIEPETGAMTRVAQLDYAYTKWLCIACNKQGTLYCIYIDKATATPYLARIRQSDGKVANLGVLSVGNLVGPEDMYINGHYSQSLFFNNADNRMYWMYESASNYMPHENYTAIMEVTPSANPTANLVAYELNYYNVTGAFFLEPSFTAPAVASDFEFIPTSTDRLNGTLNFKIPTTDYVGNPLSGALSLKVTEGDNILVETTVQPGADFVSDVMAFTNETHTVHIQLTNNKGEEGPTIKRSFYAGFDIPRACQNIKLTSEGLTTTLTWEPPVEGANGSVINPNDLTYTVIRYPYEITVAEGLKECKFVEEHPAEMTRYVYIVKAVDSQGREGESAFSNNLIVGTPLDPPYGGYFSEAADLFNYYTIIDSNSDGCSWTYNTETASAMYKFHYANDGDDWLIAPPINYKKGKTYELKFKAYSYMIDYLEAMEVRFGNARTPEAQSQLLLHLPEVPGVDEDNPVREYTTKFTVEEDGVYYYSFHAISPAYSSYLFVFQIRVAEEGSDAIEEIDTDADAVQAFVDNGQLHIVNPYNVAIAVYTVNGSLVLTTDETTCVRALPAGVYIVKANNKAQKVVLY